MPAIAAVLAAIAAIFAFSGKSSAPTQPADELGTRAARISVDDGGKYEVFVNYVSSSQFAWYAYKDGTRIGSGSEADDDAAFKTAWEFLAGKISGSSAVKLEIFGPNGIADGDVHVGDGSPWRWSAKAGSLAQSAPANTRGAGLIAMLDWIEQHISKQGVGQPGAGQLGKVGNGIAIDDRCRTIALTDFRSFFAYAKPRIESAFSGNKPPTATTLATRTIGPAAGVNGCPGQQTMINGKPWSEIEPVVKQAIADVVRPDWLSVAEPTAVIAHLLVNTQASEPGVVENYHDHAIVVRPRAVGGGFEALIFPTQARTLDADAEVLFVPGFTLPQMVERARQRVNAIDGGVIDGLSGGAQQGQNQAPPGPKLPSPPKNPGAHPKDWACATTGYNPAAQTHQIPQVGWAARKTAEIELFRIEGKWANCTRYDVRVGLCLRTSIGASAYGELAQMLSDPSTADMRKVPVYETSGGTLAQDQMWHAPPAFKAGIRVAIKKHGNAWQLDGDASSISATEASINACPGIAGHWPLPQVGAWFNVYSESGAYVKWDPKVTTEIYIAGNRVMLRVGYSGLPQFKRKGSKYRALYATTPLALSTRVDARGEP